MIFDLTQILHALLGGLLIGFSASIMLTLNGRVTGISGILSGVFSRDRNDLWKVLFLTGLISGGLFLQFFHPLSLESSLDTDPYRIAAAGLLVGFGTRLGSGCTSGHGVCGISRLSTRSLVATFFFMLSGILSVLIFGVS